MAYEVIGRAAIEFGKPSFCEAPEVLYAVRMALASSEPVRTVEDPVTAIPIENQSDICLSSVETDDRSLQHRALYHGQECLFGAILNYCHEDLPFSFQKNEHKVLSTVPPPFRPPHSSCAKMWFVLFAFADLRSCFPYAS